MVATKGTPHIPKTSGATDVGIDPCTGAQAPFPNQVKMSLLTPGTSRTFIANQPIWTQPHQVGPASEPSKAPFVIGVSSGTHIEEAKATSYSSDVFAEGAGVVRTNDTTTQNHANTVGYVDGSALAGMPNADVDFLMGQCTIVELTGVNEATGEAADGFSTGAGAKVSRNLGYPGAKQSGVPPYYIEILSGTEVKFKAVRKDVTKPQPDNPTCWKRSTHTKWLAKRTGEGACDAKPLEGKDEYTVTAALTSLLVGNDDRTLTKGTNNIREPKPQERVSDLHRNRPGNQNLTVETSSKVQVQGALNSLEAVFAYFLYWAMPVNVNVQAISCAGSRNAQIRIFPKQKVAVEVNFSDSVETNLATNGKGKSAQKALAQARSAINKLRGVEVMVKKIAELAKKDITVQFCSEMKVGFEICFKPCAEEKMGFWGKMYTPAHCGMPWKITITTPTLIGIQLEFSVSLLNIIAPGIGEGAATALRTLGVKIDLVFTCSLQVPLSVSVGADEYGFWTNTGVEIAIKPTLALFIEVGTGVHLVSFGARFPASLSAAFTASDKPKVLMQLQPKGELKTILFLTILEDTWFENTWEKEFESIRVNWVGPKFDLFTQS
ncbi:Hypothetical protein CAP_1941 [Chondromyces apiculatus DSM 436]|uniref:Uncharacterized protein n=1 Tax=Chondromyces apiculatus DSM 436 TaxID=1192034 RepID=A0A017TCP4_9BACT|nr:Hypothetical protein CAP_1941 [Chondromyces apiculatus DSM 436]